VTPVVKPLAAVALPNNGGNGVAGFANATTGLNFGVLGITASSGGVGVQGGNSSTGGFVALAGPPSEGLICACFPKRVLRDPLKEKGTPEERQAPNWEATILVALPGPWWSDHELNRKL
jgi:hypothetical protein